MFSRHIDYIIIRRTMLLQHWTFGDLCIVVAQWTAHNGHLECTSILIIIIVCKLMEFDGTAVSGFSGLSVNRFEDFIANAATGASGY